MAIAGNCEGACVRHVYIGITASSPTWSLLMSNIIPCISQQDQLNSLRFQNVDEFLSALAKVFAASTAELGAQASLIVTDLEQVCAELGLSSTAFGGAYRAHCSVVAQNGIANVVTSPLLAALVSTSSPALVSANQPASSGIALKSQVPSVASVSSAAAPLTAVTKELRQSKLNFAPASTAVAAVALQSPTFPPSRQPDPAVARVSEPALPAAQSAALKRVAAADKVAVSPLKNCISNPIASTQRLASVGSAPSTSTLASASAFSSSPFASVYLKASATAHHHVPVSRSDELRQCLAPALSSRMYANDITVESSALGHGGAHDQLHLKDIQCHWGSVACHASAATTTGSVRDLNQDRFCLAEMPGTGVIFGVFDGMCVCFCNRGSLHASPR